MEANVFHRLKWPKLRCTANVQRSPVISGDDVSTGMSKTCKQCCVLTVWVINSCFSTADQQCIEPPLDGFSLEMLEFCSSGCSHSTSNVKPAETKEKEERRKKFLLSCKYSHFFRTLEVGNCCFTVLFSSFSGAGHICWLIFREQAARSCFCVCPWRTHSVHQFPSLEKQHL